MRRLSAETAEAAKPDAASRPSGPDRGHPETSGRWPHRRATSRGGRRPKPRTPRSPRNGDHQWRITGSLLQGLRGASLKHCARDAGGTGGLAVIYPECLGVARCRGPRVRRRQACAVGAGKAAPGPRCPAPPRTFCLAHVLVRKTGTNPGSSPGQAFSGTCAS